MSSMNIPTILLVLSLHLVSILAAGNNPKFASPLIEKVYPVIKNFQKLVEVDPKNILKTWVGTDICSNETYVGLQCATFPGTDHLALSSIQFNEFEFGGKNLRLDNFLDKLEEISIFHANTNNFVGSVPQLGHLSYLFELDLSNNKLSGEFPRSVLQATNLTYLDLRYNSFSGPVPPEAFKLDLDAFFINNNNFVQSIPSNLGSITAMYLTFAHNRFEGAIPESIGDIKSLQEALFMNNSLTGCLPSQIGKLSKLIAFDAELNQLTGPLPNALGCLHSIEILNLAKNNLYGTIPESFCELITLKKVSLSSNYFTGIGPICQDLVRMKVLDVGMNCLPDFGNQRTPEECSEFLKRKQSCPKSWSDADMTCSQGARKAVSSSSDQAAYSPFSYGALTPSGVRSVESSEPTPSGAV